MIPTSGFSCLSARMMGGDVMYSVSNAWLAMSDSIIPSIATGWDVQYVIVRAICTSHYKHILRTATHNRNTMHHDTTDSNSKIKRNSFSHRFVNITVLFHYSLSSLSRKRQTITKLLFDPAHVHFSRFYDRFRDNPMI